MNCSCHLGPLSSSDPRHQRTCARCGRLCGPPRPARDREFERPFLSLSGSASFAADVLDRVDRMDAVHGSRWAGFSLERMLAEIDEEALDLGGWPVLTAQSPKLLELDDERIYDARLLLQEITKHGAQVRVLVALLRSALD